MKKSKITAFFVGSFILIATSFSVYKNFNGSWSTFVSYGGVTGHMFKIANTLIYGTDYTKLYFLDVSDRNNVSTIDLNIGNVMLQVFQDDNVLVISGDTLSFININNKKIIWQFSNSDQNLFEKAIIYNDSVYASSSDGTLKVLNKANGKLLWTFKPKNFQNLSSILLRGDLNYFGYFIIADNTVYLASRDKTFYALSSKNGSVFWKTEIKDLMTSGLEHYGKYLYVTTDSGKTIALDKFTGKILWQSLSESPVICSTITSSFALSYNPILQFLADINERIRNWFYFGPIAYFELHTDGTVVRRDGATGNVVWKSDKIADGLNCPTIWKWQALFTSDRGNVFLLSLDSGKKLFEKSDLGIIHNSAVVKPKFDKLIPKWLNPFVPDYFINNTTGDLFFINGRTGKNYWKFSASAPTISNTEPIIDNNYIFFATSDGVIYKIGKDSGLPDLTYDDQKFNVTQTFLSVADVNIFELSLTSNGTFTNPWREANLTAVFTHESGKVIEMPGFYYDQNIWKVRFNPPLKGKWKWKILWTPHGKTLTKSGELVSNTDTSNFYLRTNNINPKRLTLDGKTIFNGLGISESMFDYNHNGTFLDDWALGDNDSLIATNSSGFTSKFRSNNVTSLENYISTYGPKGAGFNMFRWNPTNASPSLYRDFMFPITYSIPDGKIGDTFITSLRENNIHIWFTFFGFDVPYRSFGDANHKYLLKSYIRYVYARYGAYVDIWEIANELAVPQNLSSFLISEINSYDYEKRPISVSSEDYNISETNIISPHWYESEEISDSDTKTAQHINQYESYAKPVVIAEQGNKDSNYDSTSAIRMRIRTWTAFFEEGIILFWNESSSKNIKSGPYPNANIYLGEMERSYTRVLQNYSKSFPLNSNKIKYSLENFGVRGYGLTSDNVNAGYFYHYSAPLYFTRFSLRIFTKNGGELQWVNPGTGNVIQKTLCPPGYCFIYSPLFNTDISFYLK